MRPRGTTSGVTSVFSWRGWWHSRCGSEPPWAGHCTARRPVSLLRGRDATAAFLVTSLPGLTSAGGHKPDCHLAGWWLQPLLNAYINFFFFSLSLSLLISSQTRKLDIETVLTVLVDWSCCVVVHGREELSWTQPSPAVSCCWSLALWVAPIFRSLLRPNR